MANSGVVYQLSWLRCWLWRQILVKPGSFRGLYVPNPTCLGEGPSEQHPQLCLGVSSFSLYLCAESFVAAGRVGAAKRQGRVGVIAFCFPSVVLGASPPFSWPFPRSLSIPLFSVPFLLWGSATPVVQRVGLPAKASAVQRDNSRAPGWVMVELYFPAERSWRVQNRQPQFSSRIVLAENSYNLDERQKKRTRDNIIVRSGKLD